ncbi:hypothetical protein [Armatimonas sp.]|uniref:hypothetical protein n=1 Tax=Armatimonas sp. TaxID=1872638 RepID=UPI00374CD549
MKPRSNTPILIAVVALALGAMVVMNRAQYQNRPRTEAEMKEEMEQQAENPLAKNAPQLETKLQDELLSVPPDHEFGNPKGKRKVVVGYSWTPEVQSDPQNASDGLKKFRQMLEQMSTKLDGSTHFRLVNTDIVRTQSSGVWLDGRLVGELDLANLQINATTLAQNLMRELN